MNNVYIILYTVCSKHATLSCEDTKFSTIDDPNFAACYRCGWVLLRLRPKQHLVGLIKVYVNHNGDGINDPNLEKEFNAAVLVYDEMVEKEAAPRFSPTCNVENQAVYMMQCFQDYGLLSEKEFYATFKTTSADISLEPVSLPWKGVNQSQNFYAVRLDDVPLVQALAMRKMRISFGEAASRRDMYLTESTQLHASQGDPVFEWAARAHMAGRAKEFQPACAEPLSFQELHDRIAAKEQKSQQQKATAAAAAGQNADGENDEQEEEDDAVVENVDFQGGRLGKDGKGKQGKKKTGKQTKGAARSSKAGSEKGSAVGGADDRASAASGRGNESSKLLAMLDADLIPVAKAHLSTSQGSSCNSLARLNPMDYLNFNVDDPKAARSLAANLNGVTRSQC